MKKESIEFCQFIDRELNQSMDFSRWEEYLRNLPKIYNNDIAFKLLFDWHANALTANTGEHSYERNAKINSDPIFTKQMNLINSVGAGFGLSYQYRELVLFHAKVDLYNKSLLEIGGSLPDNILFEHIGVDSYINIEAPDYIEETEGEGGNSLTEIQGSKDHQRRKTILAYAEDMSKQIELESIDYIISTCCFEHIYDLGKALEECNKILKPGGELSSFFMPIYSCAIEGDHGTVKRIESLDKIPQIGFHLLSKKDQRAKLIELGLKNVQEIQDYLGYVHFNRVPNRLTYEDYERILTESPLAVLRLERFDIFNMHKSNPEIVNAIRTSNPSIDNLMTLGFRVDLLKINNMY